MVSIIMENIFKVRVKTHPDPRGQYPSERRYSASTVLGLTCFHLFFATLSSIFAVLEIYNYLNFNQNQFMDESSQETDSNAYKTLNEHNICYSLTSFILTVGGISCGISGLLAWKKWYIDANVKWFFLSSCLSIFTSLITLVFNTLSIVIHFEVQITKGFSNTLGIHRVAVQIVITSIFEFICSIISATLGYSGMNATYPDDIVVRRGGGGQVEINTIFKGNKKLKISPPDILNHFHVGKYFPKKNSANLPRIESCAEYRERVDKFLTSSNENVLDEKKL
nr:uncharacterized protein LOC111413074 [Onthophagus taurus]XP_022899674.1 uncharacterized protein LOC111413074 [Onthophagus taurus]